MALAAFKCSSATPRGIQPTCSQPQPQLTGSLKGKQRLLVNEQLQRGDIDIVVGTHALISDSTQFARLGLAVVDEQHK